MRLRALAAAIMLIASAPAMSQPLDGPQCPQMAVAAAGYAVSIIHQREALGRLDLSPVRERVSANTRNAITDFEASSRELRTAMERHQKISVDLGAALARCNQ